MGTVLSRLEFKQNYAKYQQGLFITMNPKRLPKDQQEVNVGQLLSAELSEIEAEARKHEAPVILGRLLNGYKALTLTRIEVLFTKNLEIDTVRTILSFCRNRKICCVWPGEWNDGKLIYATPEFPEYYECDVKGLNDLFIIVD